MNCDDRRDLILLYVAGALDAGEVAELQAHLAGGCPACAGALAEAHAVLAQLPLALPPVAPSEELTDRVMARIRRSPPARASDTRDTRDVRDVREARRSPGWWTVIGAAAAAACLSGVLVAMALWWPAARKARLVDAADTQVVSLAAGRPQARARGRIFWDRSSNKWHVVVFDLNPPGPGKAYELWFIRPDQTKVAAATFNVDPSGHAALDVNVPLGVGDVAAAAITDEPAQGVSQPTGTIQLVGHVQ